MPPIDPQAARRFATEVVRSLRAAGYEAYWAGGCVRDQLLGLPAKDYDVATGATPDQIRGVFGRRNTLAIGASFGVITVLGPRGAGQVEVATFRQDAAYSDGRHPDHVTFSDARQDAQRRDFTINGLFFDPLTEKVIDYVGGEEDLGQRLIRAIGDPHQRLDEDKLRMLRAVRFAAAYQCQIDPATLDAIRQHAAEIKLVSAERIGEELRRMLVHDTRRRAVELLAATSLLEAVLAEAATAGPQTSPAWTTTLEILDALQRPTVSVAVAALLRTVAESPEKARQICRRWRLSNDECDGVALCLKHEALLRGATAAPWPRLQRVLISPRIEELLAFAAAVAQVVDGSTEQTDLCRRQLARPVAELDPPPLLTGDDLQRAGIPPGPVYKQLLDETRDAQLEQQVRTSEQALNFALELFKRLA